VRTEGLHPKGITLPLGDKVHPWGSNFAPRCEIKNWPQNEMPRILHMHLWGQSNPKIWNYIWWIYFLWRIGWCTWKPRDAPLSLTWVGGPDISAQAKSTYLPKRKPINVKTNSVFRQWPWRRDLLASSPPATEKTGIMDREIESRQGW
jgi:hypothetical protein